MISDFTLIIPTYKRPRHVDALARHIGGGCACLLLDSSPDPHPLATSIYPNTTHPFEKFADGIEQVQTEFCALCADDDVVLLDGIEAAIAALRANPEAPAARGSCFAFRAEEDGSLILGLTTKSDPIDQPAPLERLSAAFDPYQATTYAVYRTSVLQSIPFTGFASLLINECMGTALTAIAGPILSVPEFVHGRSWGPPVDPYKRWHPLEFFLKDALGFGTEYGIHLSQDHSQRYGGHRDAEIGYRDVLAKTILASPQNSLSADRVYEVIDAIHLRYLAHYAPKSALDFFIKESLAGRSDFQMELDVDMPNWEEPSRPQLDEIAQKMQHYRLSQERTQWVKETVGSAP